MRQLRRGAFVAAAALLTPRLLCAVALTVSPATIVVTVEPGSSKRVSVSISNTGDAPVLLEATLFDWWYEDDEFVFPPPGSSERSAALWSSVLPRNMLVEPRTMNQLILVVAPPETASAAYYALLLIDSSQGPTLEGDSGAGLAVAGRIGVLVAVRIDDTGNEAMEIEGAAIDSPTASTPLAIAARVKNTGDVHLKPESRALILDSQGQARARLTGRHGLVLPGQEAVIRSAWGGELTAGTYTALITVVFGEGKVATIERSFVIESP